MKSKIIMWLCLTLSVAAIILFIVYSKNIAESVSGVVEFLAKKMLMFGG